MFVCLFDKQRKGKEWNGMEMKAEEGGTVVLASEPIRPYADPTQSELKLSSTPPRSVCESVA